MRVDSYPELFTTLFGWQFYGMIWDVLSALGIVFVPFIVIVVRNWMEPARDLGYRSAWTSSLAGMEVEFYVAVFVAAVAGSPAMTLSASTLTYASPDSVDAPATTATVATPNSSYGGAGAFAGTPDSVKIPIWWYTVMTLSKGLNHAIIQGLPDEAGLRAIQNQAQLASIPDAGVRREASQFYNDCYVVARAKYLGEQPPATTVDPIIEEHGKADPEWVGSHLFRTLYYPNLRARKRVSGWPYDPARDKDYNPDDPNQTGGWGQPTCEQWWAEPDKGLREKIIASTAENASLLQKLSNGAAHLYSKGYALITGDDEKARDMVVRKALDNARTGNARDFRGDDYGTNDDGLLGWRKSFDFLAGLGAAWTRGETEVKLQAVRPVLPLAQALILMAIYMLLPFVVVFSSYSLGAMIIGGIAIFTVNFWSVLWKIGQWVDENLMSAMYPGELGGATERFLGALMSESSLAQSTSKAFILDTMLALFMFGLPLLFSVMMGWAGLQALGKLSQTALGNAQRPADEAAQKGAGMATRVVGAATKAKKGAGK